MLPCSLPSLLVPHAQQQKLSAYASAEKASGNRFMLYSSGPLFLKNCTYAPSTRTRPSWRLATYSSRLSGVKPHFFEITIFWRPGNLYWLRRRASMVLARSKQVCQYSDKGCWVVLEAAYWSHECGKRGESGRC